MAADVIGATAEMGRQPELAAWLRVPRKTLWRWRTCMDIPAPRHATRLAKWAHRERLAERLKS